MEWFAPTESPQAMYREMENRVRKPGESIEQYYYDKVSKARRCGLTDVAMIEYIITGLGNDSLITATSMYKFKSPPELLQAIRQLEDRLKIANNKEKPKITETGKSYNRHENKETNNKNYEGKRNLNNGSLNQDKRKPRINEKGEFLCYNCSEYGHIATSCPQPSKPRRNQGTGRTGNNQGASNQRIANNNTIQKTTLHVGNTQASVHDKEGNEKFFMDADIDDQPIQAYIDIGSQCNAIRESNAKELKLKIEPVPDNYLISGYGSATIAPKGRTKARLKVDQASAEVEILIVPDETQKIPLLVGQPFTEQRNISYVKDMHVLRIFERNQKNEESDECLQNLSIPELPSPKISLWTKTATVIPNNYIGFINLRTETELSSTENIFVETQLRMNPGKEYFIPRGIYTASPENEIILPVINVSENPITFEKDQRMVRAETCQEQKAEIEILHVEPKTVKPITMEEIEVGSTVSPKTKERLCSLLNEYRDCFAANLSELGKTETTSMKIELTSSQPITFRPYRLASTEKEKVRTQLNELMEADIIEHSTSPYASPMLVVKKKNGGERLCIDYRALNRITKKDAYPLPIIDEQLERLQGNDLFTSLDLMSGYYQIPVEEESREKTAFITPDGHFQFKTMPFGLSTAPAVFQRMMDKVLGALKYEFALTYLDDVLLPSNGEEEGLERLKRILEVIRKSKLTLNLKKCKFLQVTIDYLGFEISATGIRPGSHKIGAVENFPTPTNLHEVRRFLGLSSYFRRFIKGFASIAEPLTRLLRKDVEWSWGPEQENTFQELKSRLIERPILALYDPKAEMEVHTDASQVGLGVILMQKNPEGKFNPIAYASRKTTKDETKYHSSELETLAVVWGLEKYRVYLIGRRFIVVTDCNSLRSTFVKKQLIPRIARWWLKIQGYEFEVLHRPGTQMSHVDALSRAPWGEPEETDASDGTFNYQLKIG